MCGPKRVIDIIASHTGNYHKAKQLLASVEIDKQIETSIEQKEVKIPKSVGALQPAHIHYLQSRGFNDIQHLSTMWNIGGIGIDPFLSWRIWIPYYYQGRIVTWTTRSIVDDKNVPRYVSAPKSASIMTPKQVLYGIDYVRVAAIICEGPIDCWAIGPGAVATSGINVSKEQILQLIDIPIRAVCFDSTDEGKKASSDLCRTLSCYPGKTYKIRLESGKDPASIDEDELQELKSFLTGKGYRSFHIPK